MKKSVKILILDEATSNLDFVSEAHIYDMLFNLNCTLIIIAHRISTIRKCNKVYVVDKNSIVESGTHKQLLAKNGVYRRIWDSQIGEDNPIKKIRSVQKKKESPITTIGDEITYK